MEKSNEATEQEVPKRVLSDKEVKKLKEFAFSPKVEKKVKEIWEMEQEQKDYCDIIGTLKPALAFASMNLFLATIISQADEIAKTIFFIIALAIVIIFFGTEIWEANTFKKIIEAEDRKTILSWPSMCLYYIPNGIWRSLRLLSYATVFFAILGFIHPILAIFYLFILIYNNHNDNVAAIKVSQEIRKIEYE